MNYCKKKFVVTDNRFIYEGFQKIVSDRKIELEFFCSPSSQKIFESEIRAGVIRPVRIREIESDLIANFNLGFSCHSKQIFSEKLVSSVCCINIHPGFNPYNRGWFPQVFSIINGLPAGATIHLMDNEIDHGDIICQEQVVIGSGETSLDVYNRIIRLELRLLEENFDKILNMSFQAIKPISEGNYNSKQDFDKLCLIDLNEHLTFGEAINKLRALTHEPYANAYFVDDEKKKYFLKLQILEEKN